jgi:predicted transcriptional regulator
MDLNNIYFKQIPIAHLIKVMKQQMNQDEKTTMKHLKKLANESLIIMDDEYVYTVWGM